MASAARLILGECVEAMATLDSESVDSIVCDPPYGLEFMGKDWDSFGAGRARIGRGGDTARDGVRGEWVSGRPQAYVAGIAFQEWTAQWASEAFRVLKPGGHLLAFGGTRTYHRLTTGIEDSGFEIRDSLHWIYGSGFPKSLDVSKAIDKQAGAEREERLDPKWAERYPNGPGGNNNPTGIGSDRKGGSTLKRDEILTSDPVTNDAKKWDGWGTALKPAHEPIVLARKPLIGTVAENVLAHGAGGLNIAAARVGADGGTQDSANGDGIRTNQVYGVYGACSTESIAAGRWPANVLLAHLPECEGHGPKHTDVLCAPGCPVAELNEMSGESSSAPFKKGTTVASRKIFNGGASTDYSGAGFSDSGGAARFFYIAKTKSRERIGGTMHNLHPTVKPIELMRYLNQLVTQPGGTVLDPFMGSGSTGCAAMVDGFRFIGVEREQDSFDTSLARIADYAFAHGREKPTSE